MSPAEGWGGGNVCLHTCVPKLGLFLCARLCQEAKTFSLYDFSPCSVLALGARKDGVVWGLSITFLLSCPFRTSSVQTSWVTEGNL